MTRDAAIETISVDCPEGAIDAEITQIMNEKWSASDDLSITGDVPSVTFGDADRGGNRGSKLAVCVAA
jgi:hypothetical protein